MPGTAELPSPGSLMPIFTFFLSRWNREHATRCDLYTRPRFRFSLWQTHLRFLPASQEIADLCQDSTYSDIFKGHILLVIVTVSEWWAKLPNRRTVIVCLEILTKKVVEVGRRPVGARVAAHCPWTSIVPSLHMPHLICSVVDVNEIRVTVKGTAT